MENTTPEPTKTPSIAPRTRGSTRGIVAGGAALAVAAIVGIITAISPNHLGLGGSSTGASSITSVACPAPSASSPWSQPADVTRTFADQNQVTTLNVGQTVEFDFDATYKWQIGETPTNILQMLTPAGYFDPAHNECIWRFKATAAGDGVIGFERRLICEKGKLCTDLVLYPRYSIHVDAAT